MVGERIGDFLVTRKLGQGGMGTVYEAVDEQIGRHVAIKVLHQQYCADPSIAGRFLNEARAANFVDHPGIVQISQFGKLKNGTAYLVMELLRGDTLRQRLRDPARQPVAAAVRIGRQIAAALAAAHDKGIVHRDLKPDNVILVPDPDLPGGERAKLLDFGIAKMTVLSAEASLTHTGATLGTPRYMAPEQCRGAACAGDRADVYSLGVMLYELLCGAVPFSAGTAYEIMEMHVHATPVPLRDREVGLPEALAGLVDAMLAKDPAHRPPMREVLAVLDRVALSMPAVGTGPAGPPGPGEAQAPVMLDRGAAQVQARRRALARLKRGALLPVALFLLCAVLGATGAVLVHRKSAVTGRPPAPRLLRWSVRTEPPGAQVIGVPGNEVLGLTPWTRDRPASSGTSTLVLRLPGYLDRQITLSNEGDQSRSEVLALVPEAAPQPPPSAGPPVAAPAAAAEADKTEARARAGQSRHPGRPHPKPVREQPAEPAGEDDDHVKILPD